MLEVFRKDVPQRLADLSAAVQSENAPEAARLFHGFRGSLAYIEPGETLHTLCGRLEDAADRGEWADIHAHWPQVQALLAAYAPTDA
jgi:HPt (histidine-containing phosphotransfer) domain-containing protein